jgi:AAHS family benzoate transporter-like MFS transporter
MSSSTSSRQATRTAAAQGFWPVLLCWVAVALDGFDLVVLGAVIPTLSKTGDLGFTDSSLTLASTVGLIGVGIGALTVGPLTDRFGRRTSSITSIAVFSLLTLAIAAAQDVTQFIVLRFLAGLGLGACLPTALAFMSEHARHGRRGSAVTRMMTGYHVGAVLTALLALLLVDDYGWRSMFVVGGVAGLLTLPVMWSKLPESESYLRAAKAREQGTATTVVRSSDVVKGRYLRVSLGLWVASFMGLLLVYGLNTWLPEIMRAAGYELGAALALLLVLNVGAVLGLLVAGQVANRIGVRRSTIAWFAAASLFLALLSVRLPGIGVYVSVLLAGVFVFSAQVLVYAYVSQLYPAAARGTALGAASGIGRLGAISGPLIGGALLTAGIAYPWGFYIFAGVAALGAVAVAAVASAPAATEVPAR